METMDADSLKGSRMRRILQLGTFVVFVWWAAVIKSVSAVFTFIFGKDYRLAMFGKNIKKNLFLLDDSIVVTNNGSYGTIPKKVKETQWKYQEEMERCPDIWFRYKVKNLWNSSLETVAKFVGANVKDLVFIANATSGINAVLRSVNFQEGDGILITNQTYGAVQMTAQEICQEKKAKLLVLNVTFPTSDMTGSIKYQVTEIVEHYEKVLQENTNVKLVIIDAITSISALKLPIKKLSEVCHKHNALVLIDGAHAPGQIPLDLERIGADFFVGNLHKWLFAPRGCAILWVSPKFHDVIIPQVVSWFHDKNLQDRFFQQGTIDHTSYTSATAAVQFYREIGGMGAITKYNSQLATWASTTLAETWDTEVLPIPESMRAPFMAVIRLPGELSAAYGATQKGADKMMSDVYHKYNVIARFISIQASLWCRVSVQVYNVKEDYMQLGDVVLQLKEECVNGFCPKVEKAAETNRWSWYEDPQLSF